MKKTIKRVAAVFAAAALTLGTITPSTDVAAKDTSPARYSVRASASRPDLGTGHVSSTIWTYGSAGYYQLVRRNSSGSRVVAMVYMSKDAKKLIWGQVSCSPYYLLSNYYVRSADGEVISLLSDQWRCV